MVTSATTFTNPPFVSIVSMIATLLLLGIVAEMLAKKLRDRNYELDWAKHYARTHGQLLREILGRQDIPDQIKRFSLEAARLMTIREAAPKLVAELREVDPAIQIKRSSFEGTLRELASRDPFIFELLRRFFETGVYAMLLRWPQDSGRDIRVRYLMSIEDTLDLIALLVMKLEGIGRDPVVRLANQQFYEASADKQMDGSAGNAATAQ